MILTQYLLNNVHISNILDDDLVKNFETQRIYKIY